MSRYPDNTSTPNEIANQFFGRLISVGLTMARVTITERLITGWACGTKDDMLDALADLDGTIVLVLKPVQIRILEAADKAWDVFWDQVAKDFPEAKTGDLGILETIQAREAMEEVVTMWVRANTKLLPDIGEEADNDNLR